MSCDAWSFCNLFKRKGPTQRLKKVNFRAIMDPSPSSGAQSTAPTGCASTGQLTRPPPTLRIPRPPTRSRPTWMPTFCWTALSMLNILFLTEKKSQFLVPNFQPNFFRSSKFGLSRAMPCDAWSLRNLFFRPHGHTQQLKTPKASFWAISSQYTKN